MKTSKREKTILGLAALAALYAGGVFLFGSGGKQASLETDTDLTRELVVEVAQSLAQNNLTATEQAVLEKTGTPWPPDPFVKGSAPSTGDVAASPAPGSSSPQFTFTGYIHAGSVYLAIINGEEYAPGDRITGTSFTVRKISQHRVLLADTDNHMLNIPMMEISDSGSDRNPSSQQSE